LTPLPSPPAAPANLVCGLPAMLPGGCNASCTVCVDRLARRAHVTAGRQQGQQTGLAGSTSDALCRELLAKGPSKSDASGLLQPCRQGAAAASARAQHSLRQNSSKGGGGAQQLASQRRAGGSEGQGPGGRWGAQGTDHHTLAPPDRKRRFYCMTGAHSSAVQCEGVPPGQHTTPASDSNTQRSLLSTTEAAAGQGGAGC
jgi:hypothetical protein